MPLRCPCMGGLPHCPGWADCFASCTSGGSAHLPTISSALRLCDLHLVAWMGLGPGCLVAQVLAAHPLPTRLPHCLLMFPIPVLFSSGAVSCPGIYSYLCDHLLQSRCFSSCPERWDCLAWPPATDAGTEVSAASLNRPKGPRLEDGQV